jgi:hypothetical protein
MTGVKTIFPKGESLRQAVRWLAETHSYNLAAIEEACQRYDLTPSEEEFMIRYFLHADQRKKA